MTMSESLPSIISPPLRPPETKLRARVLSKHNDLDVSELPSTYHSNSAHDDQLLEQADLFRKRFAVANPRRSLLLLAPKNECGVQKFVSLWIRPSKLPFKQLYDYDGAARFVADYLTYEPLHEPRRLPEHIVSPSTTLRWQAGSSFDLAALLVSILVGAGYDAYCVLGAASVTVAGNDQSGYDCPYLLDASDKKEEDPDAVAAKGSSYSSVSQEKPKLESDLLKKLKREEEAKAAAAAAGTRASPRPSTPAEISVEPIKVDTPPPPPMTHCWVLVLPPKRQVEKPFFIEVGTGKVLPQLSSPEVAANYLCVEQIWNHKNCWINLQQGPVAEMSFDLADSTKWEFVIPTADTQPKEAVVLAAADGAEVARPANGAALFELPPSFSDKLELSKEDFELQYPGCSKTVLYKRCKLELFTEYFNKDGLVRRLSVFDDDACEHLVETREIYANRKDFLIQRTRYHVENKIHEQFSSGRSSYLADHIVWPATKRELRFYPSTRIDGLVRREMITGTKIIEHYDGRDDRVIYRSASLDSRQKDPAFKISDMPGALGIRKMVQKYARNPDLPASSDVQKHVFNLEKKQIEVFYHRDVGRITASSRTYTLDGATRGLNADPLVRKPTAQEIADDHALCMQLEKECLAKMKDTERKCADIIDQREDEESNIQLVYSVWEAHKDKSRKLRDTEASAASDGGVDKEDYVSIFVNSFLSSGKKKLNAQTAKQVYQNCLKAYRERLTEKEQLLLSRLEKETKALRKRQMILDKNQDMQVEEEQEHRSYILKATFRKRILEKRLMKLQSTKDGKIDKIDQRLRSDVRLAPFLASLAVPPATRGEREPAPLTPSSRVPKSSVSTNYRQLEMR